MQMLWVLEAKAQTYFLDCIFSCPCDCGVSCLTSLYGGNSTDAYMKSTLRGWHKVNEKNEKEDGAETPSPFARTSELTSRPSSSAQKHPYILECPPTQPHVLARNSACGCCGLPAGMGKGVGPGRLLTAYLSLSCFFFFILVKIPWEI